MRTWSCLAIAVALLVAAPALPCTSILVTKGASTDGSTFITYSADSHEVYGDLVYYPAAKHAPGSKRDVYEWDTGKYLGQIDEVPETYAVVGNMNEHQLSIGESTWEMREELRDPTATVDYGSLMYLALQRAKTARQAIDVMTSLVAKHGFRGSGESYSIADPNEVWLLEMVGKGPGSRGAVWVARRVPDGYVTAHANAARIRQFPLNSSADTLYAPDVVKFARAKGWFQGKDSDFSFADTYGPPDFSARRHCDARVWCVFHRAAPSQKISAAWPLGVDLQAEPLPLWVKPDRKLTARDVMGLMRDHFEGTPFDMTRDLGAGPYALPYRWRPLTWKVDGKKYTNERAVSTQQTGFSFVAQARSWLPDPVGGLLWFGVDDTYSTVYYPVYAGSTGVSRAYAVGTGSFHQVTWDSAFWVFNLVTNFTYLRYSDMIQDVRKAQLALESKFAAEVGEIDAAAAALYKQSPRLAKEYVTRYSTAAGDEVVARWRELIKELLYKYLDGNLKDEHGKVLHPTYSEAWRRAVAQDTGDRLRVGSSPWEAQLEREHQERVKATAQAVRALLAARRLAIDEKTEAALAKADDLKVLEGWLVRAATAPTAAQVVGDAP